MKPCFIFLTLKSSFRKTQLQVGLTFLHQQQAAALDLCYRTRHDSTRRRRHRCGSPDGMAAPLPWVGPTGPTELKRIQEVEVLLHMLCPPFPLCLHTFLCAKWRFTDLWEVWSHLFTPGSFKGTQKEESLSWLPATSSYWSKTFQITSFTSSWVMPWMSRDTWD